MKSIFLLFCVILIGTLAQGQTSYMSLHTSGRFDQIISVSGGGYLTSGFDSNYAHQYIRWDAGFNPVWKIKLSDSTLSPFSNLVIEANDGSFYLGASSSQNTGSFVVTKVSASGSVLWQKRYTGGAVNYSLYAPCLTKAAGNDNGFVFGTGACSLHNVLVKCDGNGNIVWQKSYTYPLAIGVITCMSLLTLNDGYIMASGYNAKSVLANRIDTAGNSLNYSSYTYTWTAQLIPKKIIQLPSNNGYALIAQTNNSNNQIQYVAFYNNALSMTAFKELTIPCQQFTLYDIAAVDNGAAVVINGSVYDSTNIFRTAVMKISNTGNILWKHFGKNSNTASVNFQHTEFTGLVANGNRTVNVGGGLYEGPFVAILDSMGNGICNELSFSLSSLSRTLTQNSSTVSVFPSNAVAYTATPAYHNQVGYTRQVFCGSMVEGISESNQQALSVYPNPVEQLLQIGTNEQFGKEAQVLLCSMDGKQVFKASYVNNMRIDTEAMPSGIYFLMVIDENKCYREKVLIRH